MAAIAVCSMSCHARDIGGYNPWLEKAAQRVLCVAGIARDGGRQVPRGCPSYAGLDTAVGSEFVRINIDAALQQEDFDKEARAIKTKSTRWRVPSTAIYWLQAPGTEVCICGILVRMNERQRFKYVSKYSL
jgi:hypothetical protein